MYVWIVGQKDNKMTKGINLKARDGGNRINTHKDLDSNTETVIKPLREQITHAHHIKGQMCVYDVGDKVRRKTNGAGEKSDTGTPLDYNNDLEIVREEVKRLSPKVVVQILYFKGDEDNPHPANEYKPSNIN